MFDSIILNKRKLVENKIPAFTECFFKHRCENVSNGTCPHKGIEHSEQFLCQAAITFQVMDDLINPSGNPTVQFKNLT